MSYGVTNEGFRRKSLPQVLSEIEESAKSIFGNDVIQTAQSPLGQLNRMFADIGADFWEIAETIYQSFDPDQAEGIALDRLAKLRLLERASGETDLALRAAITNVDRVRFDLADIEREIREVNGVEWTRVYVNDTAKTNSFGMDPGSLALAVIGGDDAAVAAAFLPYVIPGTLTYGNHPVTYTHMGYCRSITLIRPEQVQIGLRVDVKARSVGPGCPIPSRTSIAATLAAALQGAYRPGNGVPVDDWLIRSALARTLPEIEVIAAAATFPPSAATVPLPVSISFFQAASIAVENITVRVVP